MSKQQKLHAESIFNIILMLLSLYVIVGSIQLGFGTLKEPDAGFFPFLGGLVILISNGTVLFQKARESEPIFKEKPGVKIFLSMILIFVFWIIVMPSLGYVIVSFMVAFSLFKLMKLEGWIKPLMLSVGIALFIYLLFDYWLYIDLPRGILG